MIGLVAVLFAKLIPLYGLIFLGYLSVSRLRIDRSSIATLLIYLFTPCIMFIGGYHVDLNLSNLSLPILTFSICVTVSCLFFLIGRLVYKGDPTQFLLGYSSAIANSGYMGIPVALILFGDQSLSLVVLASLGFAIYENSMGFYLAAKGHHTAMESFLKVLRLPTIYAFLIGLLFNYFQVTFSSELFQILDYFKGAYSVLGMMMIGMGLATIRFKELDGWYIGLSFVSKFVVWPLLAILFIFLDSSFFHIYSTLQHQILILMAIVPMAANTVAIATEVKLHPEKAAAAVMFTTLFALIYLPVMATLLL